MAARTLFVRIIFIVFALAVCDITLFLLSLHSLGTRSALARRLNVLQSDAPDACEATAASIWEDADLNDLKCLKPTGRSQCARPMGTHCPHGHLIEW